MKLAALLFATFLLADPYWIEKAPREWSQAELDSITLSSPWARPIDPPISSPFPAVQSYLATAGPIRQAEVEQHRRLEIRRAPGAEPGFDPFSEEYRLWLEEFGDTHVILAVRINNQEAYFDGDELDRFEEECTMRLAGRRVPMTGYFPPWSQDPFLRIAFPKDLTRLDLEDLDGERLEFELYLPGISGPFREAQFPLTEMLVGGELEI